jgi:hypothetical protein
MSQPARQTWGIYDRTPVWLDPAWRQGHQLEPDMSTAHGSLGLIDVQRWFCTVCGAETVQSAPGSWSGPTGTAHDTPCLSEAS